LDLTTSPNPPVDEMPQDTAEAQPVTTVGPSSNLELHPGFHSEYLPDDRNVIVYLPPDYERSERRYPVMYMHDGQNLFDPETSFVKGRTWQVGEHADQLIRSGEIEPLIVVGVYNTPRRLEEYTHAKDKRMGGGEASLYGQMLVNELKPWIDAEYRTLLDESNTAIGGSSLGGLVSLYLGLERAETFGKLAVMSPSIWWNHKSILGFVNEYQGPPWPKIWLDVGDGEGRRVHADVDQLYARLQTIGWKPEVNLHYQMVAGGTHDEAAWAARVGDMLKFLFPANGVGPELSDLSVKV
jgi:predicted alpha/beta superfamily hydrolase